MKISWFGQACFKIQGKDVAVVVDPYDPEIGLKSPVTKADIVISTDDCSDSHNISAIKDDPFVVITPGEYEVKDVLIHGLLVPHGGEDEKRRITIFQIVFEGMNIVHLGDLAAPLHDQFIEALGSVDILFVPIGGNKYTLDTKQAIKVINDIEPRIVIPMQYKVPGLIIDVDDNKAFIQEMGVESDSIEDFFRVTKRDLPQEDMEVVILNPLKAR